MNGLGLMFHHFCEGDRHPVGQGAISADQFRALLDGYPDRILDAREWADHLIGDGLAPGDTCLTFDDGLRCQYDVALPVLQERGIGAFWFPYTAPLAGLSDRLELYRYFRTVAFTDIYAFYDSFDTHWRDGPFCERIRTGLKDFDPTIYLANYPFYSDGDRRFRFIRDRILGPDAYFEVMDDMIDRTDFDIDAARAQLWMTGDQLRQLHDTGHVIGLHSHTHPTRITDLPLDQQQEEFDTNLAWIKSNVGIRPFCVSYPCGAYDDRLIDALLDRGVRIGFQSRMGHARSLMEMPRLDHTVAITAQTQTSTDRHGIE